MRYPTFQGSFFLFVVSGNLYNSFAFSTSLSNSEVFYFAYGSNMLSDVLERRRNIVPLETSPAVAHGHRLSFSALGVPPAEPSFASIEPDPSDVCHGVLYRISKWDWALLRASEGAIPRIPVGYQVTSVSVTPYQPQHDADERSEALDRPSVNALTLRFQQPHVAVAGGLLPPATARRDLPLLEAAPSRRYLGLLIRGAKEKGLDEPWQRKLEEVRPALWT
jgi:hypothetical protein